MSSIDFDNFLEASRVVTTIANGIYVVVVAATVLIPVRGITCIGMAVIGTLCSFPLTILSSSASISLIYAFCSIISFSISSLWPSVSAIYFAYEYSMAGSFSCFLKEAMSSFFFFSSSSTSLTFDGSYPILSTNSSRDFILLSLAREDIFSSFN